MSKIRVTIWNEYRHEKTSEKVQRYYPDGIHRYIAGFLSEDADLEITCVALDDPECGLPNELLEKTDVLMWWGHMAHKEVPDELVKKIRNRVYHGMGFIALHSAHHSKPFKEIVGTTGNLTWGRDQKEIIWNLMPAHPIAAGIPKHFCLEKEELYAEPFAIPQPDALVFGGWYEDGYIFRSGACFLRGAGKIFYFQPGHESRNSFHNPYVQRILKNAVHWAAPIEFGWEIKDECPHSGDVVILDEFENK